MSGTRNQEPLTGRKVAHMTTGKCRNAQFRQWEIWWYLKMTFCLRILCLSMSQCNWKCHRCCLCSSGLDWTVLLLYKNKTLWFSVLFYNSCYSIIVINYCCICRYQNCIFNPRAHLCVSLLSAYIYLLYHFLFWTQSAQCINRILLHFK